MAKIGQNVGNIQTQHQTQRAENDAKNEEIRSKTEQAKTEAQENAKSAFEEININHSDTLTGALVEGAKDFGGAILADINASVMRDLDTLSDAATYVQDYFYDQASYKAEGAEILGSVASDVAAGLGGVAEGVKDTVGGFFKGVGETVSGWFNDGLNAKYDEE